MTEDLKRIKGDLFEQLKYAIAFNGQRLEETKLANYCDIIGDVIYKNYDANYLSSEQIEKVCRMATLGTFDDDKVYPKNVINWFRSVKIRENDQEHEKLKYSTPLTEVSGERQSLICRVILRMHILSKYEKKFINEINYSRGVEVIMPDETRRIKNSLLFQIADHVERGFDVESYLIKIRESQGYKDYLKNI